MGGYHRRKWQPIDDLPENWRELSDVQTNSLAVAWHEQAENLRESDSYSEFLVQLRRKWAIETGILERLYTLSEGASKTLIEKGLDAALIGDDDTDRSPRLVVAMIKDQYAALEGLYQFVGDQRPLGTSYIKELHRVLTTNQDFCEARDMLGQYVQAPLRKGIWKDWPNNVEFNDGSVFQFCPPEQVDSEMETLIALHNRHESVGVPTEVEAAWLHHRFTLIHPFQDGNGRVARCLATLVMLKANWFPLVVMREDRASYIESLRKADDGDLAPLISLFGSLQRKAIREALSEIVSVKQSKAAIEGILSSAKEKLVEHKKRREQKIAGVYRIAEALHQVVSQRLLQIKEQVDRSINGSDSLLRTFVDDATGSDPKSSYFRYQIHRCAKRFGYFANLELHRSWVRLVIETTARREFLFSFHGIGHEALGFLVCAGLTYERGNDNTDEKSQVGEIEPLNGPFEFAFHEKTDEIRVRFNEWLENCIYRGLETWKAAL